MEKLAMGNYGVFVWSSMLLTALILALNEWSARRRHRIAWRDIEARLRAREAQR